MTEFKCPICNRYFYTASRNPDFTQCPYCKQIKGAKELMDSQDPLLEHTLAATDVIFKEGI